MSARRDNRQTFAFGPLSFATVGDGVFCGQEKLRALVAAMSADELRAANQDAWKQRRKAERLMARYANVSIHGDLPHDNAAFWWDVSQNVCRATWAALQGGAK